LNDKTKIGRKLLSYLSLFFNIQIQLFLKYFEAVFWSLLNRFYLIEKVKVIEIKKQIIGILLCMLMVVPLSSVTADESEATTVMMFGAALDQNVTIVDFQYIPASVTVSVATKVIWTNNGPSLHTVTSNTNIFDSGNIPVGQKWNYTFNTTGSYPYHCTLHPAMQGTVTVTAGANQPPNTPTTPTGPVSLNVGQSGTYSTSAVDPDGNQVQYRFDFDANGAHAYSAYTALVPSGQTGSMSYSWNTSGTYVVKSQARDSFGLTSDWSNGFTVVISSANQPPNIPVITGPSTGNKGVMYQFSATATDPNGDAIQYYFDFGDGTNSGWTPTVNSGVTTFVNHTWNTKGSYIVKVKARDTSFAESPYASLPITIPVEKTILFDIIFLRIFYRILMYFFPLMT
jgi:plastocyanin